MYICPTCQREFDAEEQVVKHFSTCWKDKNPCHKSKSAPQSESITTREVDPSVLDFFNAFQGR